MAASSGPLTHDFTPALAAFDSYHEYSASLLSGGLVNFTARVNISDAKGEHECPFRDLRSVVAKYAPAFVASIGESAPFSQYRQVIEARALALLSQPSVSAYIESSNVTFPKLIHHNPNVNVLVMSDLGDAQTLDKWLISGPDVEVAAEIGKSFGEFLARLGSVAEYIKQEDNPLNLFEHFDNPSIHELIFSVAVGTVESHLLKCGYDPADAAFVGRLCISLHERQQARLKRCEGVFGIGDSWPKSFLIDGKAPKLKLSVVDWEFAGMTGPLIDLSQLCAHLYLLCQTSSPGVKSRVKAYALAMVRAHHAHAPEWQYQTEYRLDAWTLFGREIVNNAIEIDWWDGDQAKKQEGIEVLGAQGAAFIKEAEQRGHKSGPL
ncbi:hypothetical protein FRC11_002606, partial [Ceratobasidium sp. 423]